MQGPIPEPVPFTAEDEDIDTWLAERFPDRRLDRVLLVNPPDADASLFRVETARRGRYTNYPPYGLAVLAAHLREVGVEPRMVNLNHEVLARCRAADAAAAFDFDEAWQARLDAEIDEFVPDLICVTCMFTMTHESFRQVCEHAARSGVPLVVGGVHASNDLQRILEDIPAADAVFLREGDRALRCFVAAVKGSGRTSELAQVVLVRRRTEPDAVRYYYVTNTAMPTPADLAVQPAHDLVDFRAYSRAGTVGSFYWLREPGTVFATVLSNRGCRAQCTFCSVRNFNGPGVRTRPVDAVLDELKRLRFDHGVGHIMWLDDDLCYDTRRAIELFDGMVRSRLDLTWDATNGILAASCKDEVIAAAAASGCLALNIGMESGNPEILRQIKKPANVDVLLKAAEVLRRYEQIHASVFLMLGFPNETRRMIGDTIRVAREMDLDWYRISQLQPLPNTPIYEAMLAQGLIARSSASEARFMAGGYGKQCEIERGPLANREFQDAFATIDADAVPTAEQLTDIWFYMNYQLNFARIFHERRPAKRVQLQALLHNLADVVAPEHGFALYFLAHVQRERRGTADAAVIERLRERLRTSPYWAHRFQAFGLSVDHLVNARPSSTRESSYDASRDAA